MKEVGVEFKKNGKQYIFFDNNIKLNIGDGVIVDTERGRQFGKVACIKEHLSGKSDYALIVKKASFNDEKQNENNIIESKKAIDKAQEIANELQLDMKFLDASFTFDRKQLILQFLADNRVDFRELAKNLAAIYKTRIELRQVGARDKAKEISGIGCCGRKICCSAFLSDLDSVGISHVKNQNLALNPSKINGVCGRLLCCLRYEDDLYSEFRKGLPEVGDKINYNNQELTVITVDIPRRKYIGITSNNVKVEVDVPINEKRRKSNK